VRALRLLASVSLLAAGAPLQAQEALPAVVAQALAAARIPAASTAVVVQEVGAPRPAVSLNAEAPMNPASVMKLLTTFAGLELLGPAYRWRTDAYAVGALREDVLEGDLLLRGYGDPKLTFESFWLLLRALRDRGLREVRGDLVLDRSHFDTPPHDAARFDAEPLRPYNVGPDALLLSFKAVRFQFVPDSERNKVIVSAQPRPESLDVVSVVRLTNGPCGDWREKLRADYRVAAAPAPRSRALFTGEYAASCGERNWSVSLLSHRDFVGGVFRQLWPELGGVLAGGVREGRAPPEAKLLYSHESAPLAEIVRDINKFSNNVMARQLYLTLGAEASRPPARNDKSLAAVRAWLSQKGLEIPELVIENGSGLSRIERISAQNLAALLLAAFRSPVMPEFVSSLPVVAVDGTLRKRMKGESVAGQAHIKSGTLAEVRAWAGYVLDRAGRRYVVVMLVNHPAAGQAQPAAEALLRWVYEQG
jgi:D-alanyl-D-alanine carboxypeptidase/D-alanyl-D-alanine-endopeptidase (penicillin-binding protein 4)